MLNRYFLKYIQYIEAKGFSLATIRSYGHHIKPFMKYIKDKGVKNIADITKEDLLNYQMHLMTTGDTAALNTQCNRLAVVKSMFAYLAKTNQIMYDPSVWVELPRKKKTLPRGVMTVREVKKLLKQPDIDTPLGLRDKAILEVFYSTGIRNSELRFLKIIDIDIGGQTLRVEKGKGGKDRIVPLGKIAARHIDEYLKYGRSDLVGEKQQSLLFVSQTGKTFSPEDLLMMVRKYVAQAKLKKHITPHSIRHTCATHLVKNRASLRHIQQLLGHSSVVSTEIYTHLETTDLKRAHKKFHPREREQNDF